MEMFHMADFNGSLLVGIDREAGGQMPVVGRSVRNQPTTLRRLR